MPVKYHGMTFVRKTNHSSKVRKWLVDEGLLDTNTNRPTSKAVEMHKGHVNSAGQWGWHKQFYKKLVNRLEVRKPEDRSEMLIYCPFCYKKMRVLSRKVSSLKRCYYCHTGFKSKELGPLPSTPRMRSSSSHV